MSLEYIEHLMQLQSRTCIEYLIHLHHRGVISTANLQKCIRILSETPQAPQASPPVPPTPPVSPPDSEKRVKRNKKKKEKRHKQKYAHLKQLRLEKSQQHHNIVNLNIYT